MKKLCITMLVMVLISLSMFGSSEIVKAAGGCATEVMYSVGTPYCTNNDTSCGYYPPQVLVRKKYYRQDLVWQLKCMNAQGVISYTYRTETKELGCCD